MVTPMDTRIFSLSVGARLAENHNGTVCVMGNMDGVHLGHQVLIDEARSLADSMGALTGAITFAPHPRLYFQPETPPFLLTPTEHKADLLLMCGVDRVFVLGFNERLSSLSPENFVRDVLHRQLNVKGIVVGSDFQFGKGRTGSADGLKNMAAQYGIECLAIEPVGGTSPDQKYSSSTARNAIREGNMEVALAIMGRAFAIRGEVQMGKRLGHTLNFPTANIEIGDYLPPKQGVYAVTVAHSNQQYTGVANFGQRPTVDGTGQLLEVHLFDFNEEIYGDTLEVALHHFIRPEQKFDGLDALKAQIARDCDIARRFFTFE